MIQKLLTDTANLDRRQALGLCALICIASRENTTITYQREELNFSDIPQAFIQRLDELDEDYHFAVLNHISYGFAEEDNIETLV